uniref:Nitrogen permease regulator 2 n=1 Tax=Heterorhabditis bacteriophora TaxID=37862 RepID=A0A1I7XA16_HETBA
MTLSLSSAPEDETISVSSEGLFGQYKFTDVPKLKAIFFAEFDNSIGPVISYQIPEGEPVVTNERFALFSAAIIPKDEMLNRLIKVNFHDYKVMGHPIGLKYLTLSSRIILSCIKQFFLQEQGFINNPTTREQLPTIMTKIFNDLNTSGECVYPITELTTMYLKLCPSYRGIEPPKVRCYVNIELSVWKRVIFKEIFISTKVSVWFRFSCTLIHMLLLKSCITSTQIGRKLRCGISLRDWCENERPRRFNVDERRLIQFGMHHQFLRKLSVYPVYTVRPNTTDNPGKINLLRIFRLCDGTSALEDLAVIYGVLPDELHDLLQSSGKFEFISK